MTIHLRKKELKEKYSLYLDIYDKGKRYYEYLGLYLSKKTRTKEDRDANKAILEHAEQIRLEKEIALRKRGVYHQPDTLVELTHKYLRSLTDSSQRQYKAVLNHIQKFTQADDVLLKDIDVLFVRDFLAYLKQSYEIQTVSNYFSKLKALLNLAQQQGVIAYNPCKEVKWSGKQDSNKTFLTLDEIRLLAQTDCSHIIVKNAFLFACTTGLRHADICQLTPKHVENNTLIVTQQKTSKKVLIPLNKTALALLNLIAVERDEPYFKLPHVSYTNILLKEWVIQAGIQKKVTFHVARHSFATNLLLLKNDLFTVAKLMGHSSLQHTQTYLKTVQSIQDDAVKGLEF